MEFQTIEIIASTPRGINMYTLVSTILFLLLTLMWRRDDLLNLLIKFTLALMTGWGGYLLYNGAF